MNSARTVHVAVPAYVGFTPPPAGSRGANVRETVMVLRLTIKMHILNHLSWKMNGRDSSLVTHSLSCMLSSLA